METINQGYDKQGKPVTDLKDAVFVIQSIYNDDGELVRELFLESEAYPGILPAPVDNSGS